MGNKLLEFLKSLKLCKTCKGQGVIVEIVNDKKIIITCPDCKGDKFN